MVYVVKTGDVVVARASSQEAAHRTSRRRGMIGSIVANRVETDLATRYVGGCQICERDIKLHDGKLVHHGYKRPGYGSIIGDCPGVGEVPYEVSCEIVKKMRDKVDARRALGIPAKRHQLAWILLRMIISRGADDRAGCC